MITQKVRFWGNSLGIRIPQAILQQIGITEGSTVSLSIEGNRVIISPTRLKYTLEELLKDVDPVSQHNEVEWGDPVGEEQW
ncbi:MAG: AbrB/MazE/SpoVT family DNA-binding domain-containing protein [Cyanobacteriota bacterium]|nr:AbrB/MazE/SpoVT family DNA-binding domain-containing protein [Cyanobacteriota bacterium]